MSVGSAEYQQGGCDVYMKSLSTNRVAVMSTGRLVTARETVRCLKGESEDHQGGCVVYRDSLITTKEAVVSKGRV